MERMRTERTRAPIQIDLNDLIQRKPIDTPIRKKILSQLCTTEDLQKNRDIGWEEWNIVDDELSSTKIEPEGQVES